VAFYRQQAHDNATSLTVNGMNRYTIILLTAAACFAAMGQVLFRVGARGQETFLAFINLPILLGLIVYAIGTMIWIFVLSQETLIHVYAFTALTFVLVYLGGIVLLNERIDMINGLGVVLVLLGLYLITRAGSTG
jgi:drug/metabolite transporter (DMT)-like permease